MTYSDPQAETHRKRYFSVNTFNHHVDHLQSSSVTTDTAGAIKQLTDYYPYGQIRFQQETEDFETHDLYTGQTLDDEFGLYYYGARYYHPVVGRFISQDPAVLGLDPRAIADPQSQNSFTYARNNPIRLIDSDGKSWEEFVNYMRFSVYVYNDRVAELEKMSLKMQHDGGLYWISDEQAAYMQRRNSDLWWSNLNNCLLCANEEIIDQTKVKIEELSNEQLLQNRTAISQNAAAGFDFLGGVTGPLTKMGKLTKAALENSHIIAGKGHDTLKQVDRLVKQYGGKAKDWFKKTTDEFIDKAGKEYQIHYYHNQATGLLKEGKIKYKDNSVVKLDW